MGGGSEYGCLKCAGLRGTCGPSFLFSCHLFSFVHCCHSLFAQCYAPTSAAHPRSMLPLQAAVTHHSSNSIVQPGCMRLCQSAAATFACAEFITRLAGSEVFMPDSTLSSISLGGTCCKFASKLCTVVPHLPVLCQQTVHSGSTLTSVLEVFSMFVRSETAS
jgi:hypothetical protein